jgi:Fur family transcriptional regulator, ferric uptake regulator
MECHSSVKMIASTQTNHPLTGNAKAGVKTPSAIEVATSKLRSAGLRITQPRLAILAALGRRAKPTSIENLHESVGANNCDLVTVYRCMAAFEDIGLVRRAFFHNGTALYEINLGQPPRYHVVCKSTDHVEELESDTSEDLRRAIETVQEKLRAKGYDDVSHIVEFFGVAPAQSRVAAPAMPVVR